MSTWEHVASHVTYSYGHKNSHHCQHQVTTPYDKHTHNSYINQIKFQLLVPLLAYRVALLNRFNISCRRGLVEISCGCYCVAIKVMKR